jgi:hypothetical protein
VLRPLNSPQTFSTENISKSKTPYTNTPYGKEHPKFIPKLIKTNSLTDMHHLFKKYNLCGASESKLQHLISTLHSPI